MNTPKLQLNRNKFSLHWGNISSLSMFSCFRNTLHHSHYNGQRLLLYSCCLPGCRNHKRDEYCTNRIVIVPKASGTLNHRSYGHIPILTTMTWFRGLLMNDSFLVRLAITFHIIAFRMTFLVFTAIATVTVIMTFPFVFSLNLFFF